MRVSECITCPAFPCRDVRHEAFVVPGIDIQPEKISVVLISEAAPPAPGDYYYAGRDPLFQRTTVQAFNDAGAAVASIDDIVRLGVYLTTAVKCGKTGYGIQTGSIKECSLLLEQELALFPNVKVLLLMGDVAIKAINAIASEPGRGSFPPPRPSSAGRSSTFREAVFPSYSRQAQLLH
jgi:uracil-DNA glycosylase